MPKQLLPKGSIPRIAVVTGASRGLGKEIVSVLLEEGFNVITGQRTHQDNIITNSTATSNLKVFFLDMRNPESVNAFAEQILDTIPYIDLLINNAGICPTYPSGASDIEQHWKTVMQVNFFAQVQLTNHLLPLLRRSAYHARVINISSGDGEMLFFHEALQKRLQQLAESYDVEKMRLETKALLNNLLNRKSLATVDSTIFNGQPAYKLSKALLNVFTRVAGKIWCSEFKNSVSFAAVCPGDVDTDMRDAECTTALSPRQAVRGMQLMFDVRQPCVWNGLLTRYGRVIAW